MYLPAAVYLALLSFCKASVSTVDHAYCSRDCVFNPCREWDEEQNCFCFCDDICSYYGDCCSNVSYNPTNLTNQESRLINMSTCQQSNGFYIQTHWAVATCPGNWSDSDIRQLCEDTHLTVSHLNLIQHTYFISESNVSFIFKNKFCAICNGIEEYVPMDILIPNIAHQDCDLFTFKENQKSNPDDGLRLLVIGGCPYYFKWPDARRWYRTCHCSVFSRAPKASLSVLFNVLPSVSETFNTQEVRTILWHGVCIFKRIFFCYRA